MEKIIEQLPRRDRHYATVAAKNLPVILEAAKRVPEILNDRVSHKDMLFRAVEQRIFSNNVANGVTFADLLQHPNQDAVQKPIEEYVASLVDTLTREKVHESQEYVQHGLGLLLVRPEVIHAIEGVYEFLDANDIDEIVSRDVRLSAEQYIALYSHAFTDTKKRPHVQRRALGYVNHDLIAIIIKHRDPRVHNNLFMQFVVDELKGVAGKRDTSTLRGGVVYDALSDIQEPHNTQARLALDPLQLYDLIDAGNSYDEGVNRYLANLPGIHIPDSSEVVKDFCVISGASTIADFIKERQVEDAV